MKRHLTFNPQFVLIYGRRREFDERPELKRLRKQWEPPGQVVMTFDRLTPARNCSWYPTVTKRADQKYRALAVPPTFKLGPAFAKDFAMIEGIPEALERNAWMSKERRAFLISRLPYWNEWSRQAEKGIVVSNSWE